MLTPDSSNSSFIIHDDLRCPILLSHPASRRGPESRREDLRVIEVLSV